MLAAASSKARLRHSSAIAHCTTDGRAFLLHRTVLLLLPSFCLSVPRVVLVLWPALNLTLEQSNEDCIRSLGKNARTMTNRKLVHTRTARVQLNEEESPYLINHHEREPTPPLTVSSWRPSPALLKHPEDALVLLEDTTAGPSRAT